MQKLFLVLLFPTLYLLTRLNKHRRRVSGSIVLWIIAELHNAKQDINQG